MSDIVSNLEKYRSLTLTFTKHYVVVCVMCYVNMLNEYTYF